MIRKLLSLLLLTIGNVAIGQNYIPIDSVRFTCKYLYEFQQDSLDINSKRNQMMTLQIGKHYSKYTATHRLYSDSVRKSYLGQPLTQALFNKILSLTGGTAVHSYCRNYIYKNYPESGDVTFTTYLNHIYPKVKKPIKFDWKVVADSDSIISGYNCKMAYTHFAGRDYIAWFTPDIPISDGPYKFYGLPGLILKISDRKNQHSFNLIQIEKPEISIPIFFKETKFNEMTANEYVKALNVRMAQLINIIQHEDGVVINDDETKSKALNNVKSRNNFIEKY